MNMKTILFVGCITSIFAASAANDWDNGGLIQVSADGCSIENCTLANCEIALQGGAIYVNGDNCTVSGCTITNCHVVGTESKRLGGGIFVVSTKDSTFAVTNTVFADCSAFNGGGVYFDAHTISGTWSDFRPRADYPLVSGCTFSKCQNSWITTASNPVGGGVYGRCWVENCHFDRNTSNDGSRAFGVCIGFGPYGVATGCSFGNHDVGSRGLVVMAVNTAPFKIINSVFLHNSVTIAGSGVTIDRCVFNGNSINGDFVFGTPSSLRNSLFVYNLQPLKLGSATIENCTFADNPAGGVENSSSVKYYNTVIAKGATGQDVFPNGAAINLTLNNSWLESADGDPLFADPANGNWTARRTSPLRDGGAVLAWMDGATDLLGRNRRLNLSGKATQDAIPDIGAYETYFTVGPTVIYR